MFGNLWGRRGSRGLAAATAAVTLGMTILAVGSPDPAASAVDDAPTSASVSLFEARAVGSVGSFSFFAPEAFFPQTFTGGMLESTSLSSSAPRGFGMAGLAPVPFATSVGLLVPEVIPGTQTPVPEDVKAAFRSIDFSGLPHSCQASFPPVREGGEEAFCGGPYQRETALGFTAGTLGGHVKASGDLDDPYLTRTVSTSRASDVTVPGLQATLHHAYSQGVTGLNGQGIPEAKAVAEMESLAFFGALVKLDGIRSETVVATDGTAPGTAVRSQLVVRSASVFGVPVVIGSDGVSINRQAVPGSDLKGLSALVDQAMANAGGFRIRLVPAPPVEVRGGTVTAQSGAIEVSYQSATPTPMDVVQRFGYTKAVVNALARTEEFTEDGSAALSPEAPTLPTDATTPEAASAALEFGEPAVPASEPADLSGALSGGAGAVASPAPEEVGTPGRVPEPRAGEKAMSTGRRLGDQSLLRPAAATLPAPRVRSLYAALAALCLIGLVFGGVGRRALFRARGSP